MRNLFYSLISLIVAIFFIMLGIIGILLPWSPTVRSDIIQFLLEDSLAISLFSFVLILIGLAIVIHIVMNARHSYYYIKSGRNPTWVDESVIEDYLDTYWKQLFPKAHVTNRLMLKKNKIHLVAELPYVPHLEQKDVLERIKNDLTELFASFLGYRQPFYLSASFQPEQKNK